MYCASRDLFSLDMGYVFILSIKYFMPRYLCSIM
jgi:hypothetical protein